MLFCLVEAQSKRTANPNAEDHKNQVLYGIHNQGIDPMNTEVIVYLEIAFTESKGLGISSRIQSQH